MINKSMIEMVVDSIRVSIVNYQQRVVILKGKDNNRYLPIWIGPSEAESIVLKLQDIDVPRPLTHDLLESTIAVLGANVVRIEVSELTNDTFYAKIVLQFNDSPVEIDARPSDAIALAVRTKCPIFAHQDVIDRAGVKMDKDGNPITPENKEAKAPLREEELKSLSAFTDFIDTLNLDDLGDDNQTKETESDN